MGGEFLVLLVANNILTAEARRQNELTLQRAVQACLEGEATANAAAVIIAKPPPADMIALKSLIHTMVGDNSKTILAKLDAMEQRQIRTQQQPKNERASTPASGSTCNKKKPGKKQTPRQQQPKANGKAAAPASASLDANTGKKKHGGRPPCKKKTKPTTRN
jgi:hypothetical protein